MSRRAPGPSGNFIMGSLAEFQKDSLGFLSRAVAEHGDFVHMRFAYITAHLINHPDYIEQVLLRNAEDFDKNTRSVAKIKSTCGDSLLSANEPAWKRQRKLVQFEYGYLHVTFIRKPFFYLFLRDCVDMILDFTIIFVLFYC